MELRKQEAVLHNHCKSTWLHPPGGSCALEAPEPVGLFRHSVSNTFVQLTEGRSARDQPKQPPAKKNRARLVFDFKSLLKALSGKEAEAHSDVDAFMEHCAKRWQTRQGTYQRRLKPDVRNPPEDRSADVDMADI